MERKDLIQQKVNLNGEEESGIFQEFRSSQKMETTLTIGKLLMMKVCIRTLNDIYILFQIPRLP